MTLFVIPQVKIHTITAIMHKPFRVNSKNVPRVAVGERRENVPSSGTYGVNRNIKDDISNQESACSIRAAMTRRLNNLIKENPTDPSVKVLEEALGLRLEYKPIHDVIVRLSSDMKDRKSFTGKNGEKITLYADTEFDKWHKVMTHGEVLAAPSKLPADVLYLKNPGSPSPASYLSSKEVENMVGTYHPGQRDKVSNRIRVTNGLYTPEFETLKGKKVDVKRGDKVYFSYLALDEENFLGYDNEGLLLYKIKYSEIFCRVRNSNITPINGHCLVKPYHGEGFKEIDVDGKTVQAKTVTAGAVEMVSELSDKPLYLQGVLQHIGSPVGELTRPDCKPGDRIVYATASDYEEEIEGETYFVMKQWDLLAKVEDEKLIPVGDYITIETEAPASKSKIILRDHDLETMIPDKGTVSGTGANVKDLGPGDYIYYDRGHGSHLPMKEFKTTLIRECAVMCKQS